jgi:hypothetical protein
MILRFSGGRVQAMARAAKGKLVARDENTVSIMDHRETASIAARQPIAARGRLRLRKRRAGHGD